MARKHNTKHNRSNSGYTDRLQARGETSATVRMPFIDRRGKKHSTLDAMLKRSHNEDQDGES